MARRTTKASAPAATKPAAARKKAKRRPPAQKALGAPSFAMPPGTRRPVAGSRPTCPAQKTKSPASTAWL